MAGVGLTGEIVPLNGASFPVFEDISGKGGYQAVPNVAARDAIPANFRKISMLVGLQDTGVVYKLDGGVTNADWAVFGGSAALTVPVFQNTFYCTPGATPSSNVFTTLQTAFDAVVPGTPTLILAAPITWTENIDVPTGLTVALAPEQFGGFRGAVNGTVTWHVATPDLLSIEGFDLPGGIAQQQFGTSNGPATLRLGNLVCDGITGAPTHAVVTLLCYGELDNDMRLGGSGNAINGNVILENTTTTGPITTPQLSAINSQVFNQITCPQLVFIATEFGSVNIICSGAVILDNYSAYQFKSAIFSGGGTVSLASGDTLEQHDAGTGGATPDLDFRSHSSLRFALDQDTTPTFAAPLYSQILELHLVQDGAENWIWNWPGNVRNPPTVPLTGQFETLIYYCRETNLYYPFSQVDVEGLRPRRPPGSGNISSGVLGTDSGTVLARANLGSYQVNVSVTINTASGAGALAVDINWFDSTGLPRTKRVVPPVLTTGQNFDSGSMNLYSQAGTSITYDIVATTPVVGNPIGVVTFDVMQLSAG